MGFLDIKKLSPNARHASKSISGLVVQELSAWILPVMPSHAKSDTLNEPCNLSQ
jgi:hypothetical protein